ncbi:hybrid sensor histidine kinase/response regulator [Paraprevotella clara]|jgi:two-component system sensor histidine kinase EvgS|uniref:histidine kinase n=1 Tax=Paraprevotella clara YIT 11840 TaxID=762968 RepID=G5SWD7_9BACT|nr:ATP-binding protein [Paraprevotella clara]EHG98602.1 ATPase/histidine kinase/DNA gyrase B/HSP90 domain protein [Paraprevotella clara YIT 11840]
MRLLLQHRILLGYIILIAVIGSMAATMLHERGRVHKIELEATQIREANQTINAAHRHITILATLGESAITWDEEDFQKYQLRRQKVDSLLQILQRDYGEFISFNQINTFRVLLANKEEHLFHTMKIHQRQDSLLLEQLPLVTEQATSFRTVTRKKKGIAGFFGAKETVQVPMQSNLLHALNRQLISRQQQISDNTDSLCVQNKELNSKLSTLLQELDEQSQTAFQNKEQHIKESYERSAVIVTILIISVIVLLMVSYWIIQRDIRVKEKTKERQEKLIEQLNKSVQENETLIASRKKAVHTITHELRTPLAAITGYTELLQKEFSKGNNVHFIENIQESSERMRIMLNTLLDFFRLDNGKEQPRLSPCRISTITHTLETEFTPIAMSKELSLTVKDGSDAIVLTDKERILQIGNNLLSNAVKFTEKGGVFLTTDYDNGILTLVVEDTGTGMTEEEQLQIFGAFERLSNAAVKDGFGLGLAIVHNIVTMLHGKTRLESKKGKGSRFTVEIPMQEAEEVPEQEMQTYIHRKKKNLKVVAIDNDEVLLLMLKEMYAQEGIHCDICTDVAELMELIRRKEYGLLLADLKMPDTNGFELLELLRSSNVGNSKIIPVVVATASGSCNAEELIERGFAGCLFKPFSISELMEASDRCSMKATPCGKPDFSTLLSYGNEAVMLEKLIAETEKEMQAVRDAATQKDLPKLDALTHHLRSSWEILRADQPLRGLYGLLHNGTTLDDNALNHAVTLILDMGTEIIRLAKEERRKFKNG